MTPMQAVLARRSIRAFLGDPVDGAVLRRVVEAAQMTPSGYNFQPWEGVVMTGEPLRDLSRRMLAAPFQHPDEYELVPEGLPQLYKERRDENAATRMASMGIGREDRAAREAFQQRNYAFFGAPAALFCFVPRVMGKPQWADVGMWLQSLMLLFEGEGLGTCPQESLYHHGRLIKQACGVDDATHVFFCGLAIGHPDPDAPVNHYRRARAPIGEVVRFVGGA